MRENEVDQLIKQQRIYRIEDAEGALPADMFKAYKAWLPLAEAGNVKAQYNIGFCLSTGRGADIHRKRAVEWFTKAAEQGDVLAHYNLFMAYRNGEGVDIDEHKADEHLQKAANLGDSRAFFDLGRKHIRSDDKKAALEMFNRATEAKHRDAEKGIGLARAAIDFGRGEVQRTVTDSKKQFINPTIKISVTNNANTNLVFGFDFNSINERGVATKRSVELPPTAAGKTTSEEMEVFPTVDLHETIQLYQYRVSFNRPQPDWTTFPIDTPIVVWTPEDSKKYRSSCFVVTVCMGDEMDPTVLTFRRFRDEVLTKFKIGRVLAVTYYRHGPKWADWISRHRYLRAALRCMFKAVAKNILAKNTPTKHSR